MSHKNSDCLLEEININNKLAICIGSEENGLSNEFLNLSNYISKIPIYGNSESYNISSSAGISIYSLIRRLRNLDINWKLDNNQLLELKINWVKKLKKI
jgi:tRNA (guanosine-2'-O-)-methyltransferase